MPPPVSRPPTPTMHLCQESNLVASYILNIGRVPEETRPPATVKFIGSSVVYTFDHLAPGPMPTVSFPGSTLTWFKALRSIVTPSCMLADPAQLICPTDVSLSLSSHSDHSFLLTSRSDSKLTRVGDERFHGGRDILGRRYSHSTGRQDFCFLIRPVPLTVCQIVLLSYILRISRVEDFAPQLCLKRRTLETIKNMPRARYGETLRIPYWRLASLDFQKKMEQQVRTGSRGLARKQPSRNLPS